jgi:hypothetical protein
LSGSEQYNIKEQLGRFLEKACGPPKQTIPIRQLSIAESVEQNTFQYSVFHATLGILGRTPHLLANAESGISRANDTYGLSVLIKATSRNRHACHRCRDDSR